MHGVVTMHHVLLEAEEGVPVGYQFDATAAGTMHNYRQHSQQLAVRHAADSKLASAPRRLTTHKNAWESPPHRTRARRQGGRCVEDVTTEREWAS